jgi:hypothetical protein
MSKDRVPVSLPPPPIGELTQRREITSDERLFLRPTPALELTLRRDRIGDAVEMLVPGELDRPSLQCIAAVMP